MKFLKRLYLVPILLSLLVTAALIAYFFSPEQYLKAAIAAIVPLIIIAVGFRFITLKRIKIIKAQLFQILETLETFDMDEPQQVEFDESPFSVFNDLNEYLIELIDRVRANYLANKQFTQNASHELQTPLAIIKGHVEILLQSPNLGQKEIESLAVILQNTNRLSKLNHALILLSKIENSRFGDTTKVNINQLTDELLINFKDGIKIQGVTIRKNYQAVMLLEMSATLAEILLANLIQNAIRYNVPKGFIEINITADQFSISNPGKPLKIAPQSLFKRFRRESNVEESLGLGLSIVKKICDQFALKVTYEFADKRHTLKIKKAEETATVR